jgi:hypothetical protein
MAWVGFLFLSVVPLAGMVFLVLGVGLVWVLLDRVTSDPGRGRIGAFFTYMGRVALGALLWLLVFLVALGVIGVGAVITAVA